MQPAPDLAQPQPAATDAARGAHDSARWTVRAIALRAEPHDADDAMDRLLRLWGSDRHAAALPEEALRRLRHYLQFAHVQPGLRLIEQDEFGDFLLVLLEGSIAVERVQPWGAGVRLAEARPGDVLGEMSLLDAGTRASACVSLQRCLVAVLDQYSLARMVGEDPRLALAVMAMVARRLSLRLRQTSARLGALLSREPG
ncbi:Crp/Fnr family transcriptional regulator [Aquabacterium sp. J223]|uniref:Crp/Fnr family transcriptional regulator n=1 Tax=Aquabacterium sp. J223 TaxID=2898431 RepID=UPI0021ADCE4C|nr:Crp/Fnr family transcriptional regulator [Aquabacterium sp. J223]UUX96234.1 Crp/Fnr family transcriptional regulator [Aquabacterium sp. J223]